MNVFFRGISFLWALAALAALAVVFGARAWLAYRRLTADAEAEWEYRVSENMQDLRLDKAGFVRAYRRVNTPRLSAYMAAGFAAIFVLTPIAFALINVGLWGLWKLTDESRVFEPGYLVWEFSIFFALIAIWALIGANVARRYHANAPGLMRDELIFERAGFMPAQTLTVGANPVHVLSDEKTRKLYKKMFEDALGLAGKTAKNWSGTGSNCDIYGDGTKMSICVHYSGSNKEIDEASHPFFFTKKHAREDIDAPRYTVVMLIEGAHTAFEKIAALDLPMEKITGGANSKMRSFNHANLDVFLYERKG